MIDRTLYYIKQGPSQWDVMLSFFEGKEIIFSLESQSRNFFGLQAVVNGIKREFDNDKSLLYLSLKCDFRGEIILYAFYNTQTRTGRISPFDNPLCNLPEPIERRDLVVDLSVSNSDYIERGNYKSVYENLLSYHDWELEKKEITATACLFHFEAGFSINTIREWIKRCNARPVDDRELLAFGSQFPSVQKHCYPILAIGGECYEGPWPCLSIKENSLNKERELCLVNQMKVLNDPYYIMAVGAFTRFRGV